MSVEERLARVEARLAIEDLIGALARAFDAGPSAAQLRPLFTDDAVFLLDQYGSLSSGQGIADGVAGNAESGFRWTLHYLVSPKIVPAADLKSAAVDFMLWEVATSASDKAYWIGGRYLATCVPRGDHWQFKHLELQADLISHYPAGWQSKPAVLSDA